MPKSIHQQVEEMLAQIQRERGQEQEATTEPQQPRREAVPDITDERGQEQEEAVVVERVVHLYVLTDEQVQEQEQEAHSVEADRSPDPSSNRRTIRALFVLAAGLCLTLVLLLLIALPHEPRSNGEKGEEDATLHVFHTDKMDEHCWTYWSWIKVRMTGRDFPPDVELGSPQLIRKGNYWWLHTPVEKHFKTRGKIEKQVTTNAQTKLCAVDLNLGEHLAVCTIQTVEGTILATKFIGGGKEIAGFRKKLLGRIARNRAKTGIIAEGEQDNKHLWNKIRHVNEDIAHLVSARIVQFAKKYEATILVFEHLGHLQPQKGKYSHRGNCKRAFWMKGRIFTYAKYKAWNEGIITSRVSPRNTSRECARCHSLVARYEAGCPAEGYTPGTPLVLCPVCGMRGNADRNASLMIGQRLLARYQQAT